MATVKSHIWWSAWFGLALDSAALLSVGRIYGLSSYNYNTCNLVRMASSCFLRSVYSKTLNFQRNYWGLLLYLKGSNGSILLYWGVPKFEFFDTLLYWWIFFDIWLIHPGPLIILIYGHPGYHTYEWSWLYVWHQFLLLSFYLISIIGLGVNY